MKKIILSSILVLLMSTIAFAEWQVDFEQNYVNKGIDLAVVKALKDGINPDSIVQKGLKLDGLNPQNLVMALYCAGAKGQDIRDAAANYNISELIVTAGYNKSVAECGDVVADSQAYTPVATGFSGGHSGSSGGGTYASPTSPAQ